MGSHTSTLPGPDDTLRHVLPNGIVVLARANFASPSVVVHGYLPQAGALHDPPGKEGLAEFTASMLLRGTHRRSHQQIFDALESMAANLGFAAHTHSVGIRGRSLAEDLPALLELLAEALREPTFPEDEVEKRRGQVLTGLAIRAQDTAARAADAALNALYDGHPYGRSLAQVEQGVRSLTRADLQAFHARHYTPVGMVLVIVGAIAPDQALEQVAATLGDWHGPEPPPAPHLPLVAPPPHEVRREVPLPGKSQTDIVLATVGPSRFAADYLPAALGNSVLGRFGMMGRIGEVVREQAGLAYYAYSSLSGGPGPGPWQIIAGVAPENVAQALDLIRAELRRFIAEGVTAEELADVQSQAIGSLPLELATNAGVAAALAHVERYRLGLNYYREYEDRIRAITVEDVRQAVQHYWHPGRWTIGIAGPDRASRAHAEPSPKPSEVAS